MKKSKLASPPARRADDAEVVPPDNDSGGSTATAIPTAPPGVVNGAFEQRSVCWVAGQHRDGRMGRRGKNHMGRDPDCELHMTRNDLDYSFEVYRTVPANKNHDLTFRPSEWVKQKMGLRAA